MYSYAKCTYLKISWHVSTILVASQSSTLQDLTIAGSSGNAVWHGKVHWGPVILSLDTKVGALGEGSFGQVLLVRGKVRQPGPLVCSDEAVATWCLCSWPGTLRQDSQKEYVWISACFLWGRTPPSRRHQEHDPNVSTLRCVEDELWVDFFRTSHESIDRSVHQSVHHHPFTFHQHQSLQALKRVSRKHLEQVPGSLRVHACSMRFEMVSVPDLDLGSTVGLVHIQNFPHKLGRWFDQFDQFDLVLINFYQNV